MTKRARARTTRAMVTAVRVIGDKENKGSKAMAIVTRVRGKRMTMAIASKAAGKEKGNGNGDKKFDGKEDGNGKWQ